MQEAKPLVLTRHSEPSKLDTVPFGSQCKVKKEDKYELYLQMSHDNEDPRWLLVGMFADDLPIDRVRNEVEALMALKI